MMQALIEMVYSDLNKQIRGFGKGLDEITAHSERAETCAGHPSGTLASAPLAAQGARAGDQYFVTNGRKTGEGAGAGTGVLCYYNPSSDSWYRPADDTAVVI